MKNKIVFLLVFTIIFNTSFAYADSEKPDINVNQVFTNLQNEFKYDEKTDTYYFPINDVDELPNENSKSATVAVSGAVISSVLALAVKAGLEFATTNSLSEFASRFFMLDGISSVVSGLSSAVKNSVNGTINFSKSLLDTVSSKFAELMNQNSVSSVYIQGRRIPLLPYVSGTKYLAESMARYVFESSTLPKTFVSSNDVTTTNLFVDSDVFLPSSSYFGTVSYRLRLYRSSRPYSDDVQIKINKGDGTYADVYSQDTIMEFDSGTFDSGFNIYMIPYLSRDRSSGDCKEYCIGFITAVYSSVTGYLASIKGLTTYGSVHVSHTSSVSALPVIGSAWSDGKITDEEDLSIKVPSDTNILINKTPTDIVSNPTYQVWTPGVTVVPPVIDTGTTQPPLDDVLPPIDDTLDPPSTDTPTDKPTDKPSDDSSSISWDWLKNLLDLIKGLIQTIVDWLTNFWDNLLDFIISLVVPSEGYWADVFEDILENLKSKIPNVDIDELEQLAVREKSFEDIYATFFGVRCLVVKASVVNEVISWVRPIIQGLIALFLLLYNYNQVYKLIRGGSLVGSTCTNDERGR